MEHCGVSAKIDNTYCYHWDLNKFCGEEKEDENFVSEVKDSAC
jgi:hypothetical protein